MPQVEQIVGLLTSPRNQRMSTILSKPIIWAVDNDCFAKGNEFNLQTYLQFLQKHVAAANRCLFVNAPDVMGDAVATWQRSVEVLAAIRALGYKASLVAQDGITADSIDWNLFDALFIGGSTSWKLSNGAGNIAREAKARGKWLHMGRVNTLRRMLIAKALHCDSVDGTHMIYGKTESLREIFSWSELIKCQSGMFLEA